MLAKPSASLMFLLCLLMTPLTAPLPAYGAQAEIVETDNSAIAADDLRSYEPDYFTQYAPHTALDMVRRVPGFRLSRGEHKRGLGQGGANVLINGQRVTGKGGDAFSQIGRISASNVVRIEILDGAALNIPGLSGDVANIIVKSGANSGTWEWEPQWRDRLKANILPFTVTLSGERGDISYTAELRNDSARRGHWGPETREDGSGALYETADEIARYSGDIPGAAVSLSWKPDADRTGNLNLEYNQFNFNARTDSQFTSITEAGFDGQAVFLRSEDEWNGKIDGDYEFLAGPGRLKLIGYYRAEHSPTISSYDLYDANGPAEMTRYSQVGDEGEAIARAEYGWAGHGGASWQLSSEGAYNFLDIDAAYIDVLAPENSESYDPVKVKEDRAEMTLSHSRPVGRYWEVQTSLGAEYSKLSQDDLTRDFIRPKGFISVTRNISDGYNLRARIERKVGQLNFYDFIASVDLEDDFDQVANINLVPSQSWTAELEYDRQFTGGHALKIRPYLELITDLVDSIPVGDDGDAIGNIDKASRYGVEILATLKGDVFGIKGLEIEGEADLRKSAVDDPVQGFSRRLNEDLINRWEIDLRHDIEGTNWAWGGGFEHQKHAAAYRLSFISARGVKKPFGRIFIEHKDVRGMKLRAYLGNLLDQRDERRQIIYTDRRDVGEIESTRFSSRKFGLIFGLNVSGTF